MPYILLNSTSVYANPHQAPCKYFMLPPPPLQALVRITEAARLDSGLLHQLSMSGRGTVHSAGLMSIELPVGAKPISDLLPQFLPLRKRG